jgi:hypothetical protein
LKDKICPQIVVGPIKQKLMHAFQTLKKTITATHQRIIATRQKEVAMLPKHSPDIHQTLDTTENRNKTTAHHTTHPR